MIKKRLPIIILFGFVVFLAFFVHLHPRKAVENSAAALYSETGVSLPVRLKIPKINVDANVESVGLTSGGAVDVPSGPSPVAWFDRSPAPGRIGSSIIDGHSGYKNGREAVFDNLYKLQKGDKIYVEDKEGTTTTFVVREMQSFGANVKVPAVFVSSDGLSHLNLITCDGVWNAAAGTHSERLVVFTDRVI